MLHEIIKKERPDQQCDLVPGEEEPQLDLERHETTRRQSLAAQRWPRQVKDKNGHYTAHRAVVRSVSSY